MGDFFKEKAGEKSEGKEPVFCGPFEKLVCPLEFAGDFTENALKIIELVLRKLQAGLKDNLECNNFPAPHLP